MNDLILPRRRSATASAWLCKLEATSPEWARFACLLLLAMPFCLALLVFDTRTIDGENVWVKPLKFLVSLAVFYATLAWYAGWIAPAVRRSWGWVWTARLSIAVGAAEMVWLLAAATLGVRSHFNPDPGWRMAYYAAGVGATGLMGVVLAQGVAVLRHPAPGVEPALRLAAVLGAGLTGVCTLVAAGVLAAGSGHFIGVTPGAGETVPVFGWSRVGGDLRIAHFLALHAQQALPVFVLAWLALRFPRPRVAVALFASGWFALTGYALSAALAGRPFPL